MLHANMINHPIWLSRSLGAKLCRLWQATDLRYLGT